MPFDKLAYTEEQDSRETVQQAEPKLWPIYTGIVLFLAGMVASVLTFGLPGLFIPAVAMVPVLFVMLIRISLG